MPATDRATDLMTRETAGWPERPRRLQARCMHPSGNFTRFEDSEVEQAIATRFERQAALHANRLAVKATDGELTYRELNESANRVAHAILAKCGSARVQVSVFLEQGMNGVIAMLGILKAGKTYVPLDVALPTVRLAFILEQSESSLILTDQPHSQAAREIAHPCCDIIHLDNLGDVPTLNPAIPIAATDLAWIIYTSGSTGQPKGVMQTQRNVLHCMRNYTNYFGVCPEDRMSGLFSFATHAGNFCILIPLTNGASLFPIDLRRHSPEDLAGWLESESVSVLCAVPTVFRRFAAAIPDGQTLDNLRLVYLCGEPILKTDFELYQDHLPLHTLFVNRLGSTEMDCIRLFFADHDTVIETSSVPVGYAVRDKLVTVLDNDSYPVEEGEICVESEYIALGYWNRPDLTTAAFEERSGKRFYRSGDLGRLYPDGSILNLGRKDHQIKIRGYRIEAAEIEIALLHLPQIKDAVVAPYDGNDGEKRLAAYIVPRSGQRITAGQLRAALGERLPDYMIPTSFVTMESLPQAPNGKVLRKALAPPSPQRPELDTPFVEPGTVIEKQLAKIWGSVLNLDLIGIDDHLLDLGADSIRVMQIAARIEQSFHRTVTASELVGTYSTVRTLAAFVQSE